MEQFLFLRLFTVFSHRAPSIIHGSGKSYSFTKQKHGKYSALPPVADGQVLVVGGGTLQ